MLTIQSFLLKLRKIQTGKDMKKNVKYATFIFAYAFIAIFIVLKFDVFHVNNDKKTLEAFAAQNLNVVKEETPVLSKMDYLNLALNESSTLKQNSMTASVQESTKNPLTKDGLKQNQVINMLGHAPMVSADYYAGDLTPLKVVKKESETEKKDQVKTMSIKEKKETKSTTKEDSAENAKETMNTGVAVLSLSNKEIEILQRIVEAEATGEDIKGKILVANVIINRVNDPAFPDTVEKVVFQKTGGTYQFSPISDKRYYSVRVTEETKEAVQRVLQGEDYSKGALYFSARKRASAKNMKWFDNNLKWLFQYGGHEFFTHK